jgi:uncharacterized protein (DUF433 family)
MHVRNRRLIDPSTTGRGAKDMGPRWQDHIEQRPDVMMGKPVFKGTRLTVEHVLRELGTGMSHDELLDNYPNLTAEQIRAAHHFAADVLAMDEVIFH